jgi:hypothetical protein
MASSFFKHGLKTSAGQAMIIMVIWIGATILITITSLTAATITHIKYVRGSIEGFGALQAAEAGAERLFSEWIQSPYPVNGTIYADTPFIDATGTTKGNYTVTVSQLGDGAWKIHSQGRSRNVWRAVDAVVKVRLGGPNQAFAHAIFSNTDLILPGNTEIWGDTYVNGIVSATSGGFNATNDLGTHFGYNPTTTEAPYGRLTYYPNNPADTWQIAAAGTTANGDAHGFWQSSQSVLRTGAWLNPQYNIGDKDSNNAGQYWNRSSTGYESLMPSAKQRYSTSTGIAVKEERNPKLFPQIGTGSFGNFVGYYDRIASQSSRFDSLVIVNDSTGAYIHVGNGFNVAIVGSVSSTNGFPMAFTWDGTAFDNDSSLYSGPLRFREGSIIWINGDVIINGPMAGKSVTIIASGNITVNTNVVPTDSFNLIAAGNVTFGTSMSILSGILYAKGSVIFSSTTASPQIFGSIVANVVQLKGISPQVTFVRRIVFAAGSWLPGGVTPAVQVIRWNEVAP